MRHSWDSSPGGSHELPLIAPPVAAPVAPPVAAPVAPPVAAPVAQPVTCQRPGTVDTTDANDLPKPHRDRSRDHAQARNETTTSNTDFPAPASRKVTTKPTRFVHPSRWLPPSPTPTFPRDKAEKSPQNQHVLSFNPKSPHNQHVLSFNPVNPRDEDGGRGGVPLVGTRGFLGATGK